MIVYPPSPSGRPCKRTVQWRHTNVQDGLVRTDPDMMSKLVSTEPLHKYYKLDPTPFAKATCNACKTSYIANKSVTSNLNRHLKRKHPSIFERGMFASVWRCRSISSGEVFAAKFSSRYRYGEDCTSEIYHEIALLSLCSPSPKIVKLHDVFQTSKEFIIVMEYAPGGDMQTIIDDNLVPFEKDVVKFIQDVVEGLAYLHHRKIAHLDIKPQNLVMMGDFPDCEIKVCDFEISRVVLDGTEVHEILGTPEYVAPEILHYEPITLAADMWSLGVTTYVLLTGFSPFGGETDQETFLNISRAQVDYPDELFEDVSEDAKDFLKKLLIRNPRERMSSKQALKHPWLVKARKERQLSRSRSRNEARIGCATCPSHNNTALRSYLSKSREALFEKVMSQGDLRKKTLIQQYNRTRRMCESQMSLIAREKSLRKESAISRSREKLYGLKSLSKSQEVLSLYKSVLNLNDDVFKLNKEKDVSVNSSSVSVAEESEEQESEQVSQPAPLAENKVEEEESSYSYEPSQSPVSTEAVTTSESEISEEEGSIKGSESAGDLRAACVESLESKRTGDGEGEQDEEPKFTVAQLVSAYNKHEEVVTKNSLEVTMKKQRDYENKMGEVFPTGPNALRLFIPDIQIRKSKPKQKKRMPRKKTGLPANPFVADLSEEVTDNCTAAAAAFQPPVVEPVWPSVDEKMESVDQLNFELETINLEDSVEQRLQPDRPDSLDLEDKCPETISDRLGVTAPPPKYLRSETSPEPKQDKKKPPYYMSAYELKQQPMSNVAKTVELFNNYRPDRKSFCSTRSPHPLGSPIEGAATSLTATTTTTTPSAGGTTEKTRRKSSPPTMKPF